MSETVPRVRVYSKGLENAPSGSVAEPEHIHFFGVQRSGNHAVIRWMAEGLAETTGGPVIHANNVEEIAFHGFQAFEKEEVQPDRLVARIASLLPTVVVISYESKIYKERESLEHYQRFRGLSNRDVVLLRSFPNVIASQMQRRQTLLATGEARPIQSLGLAAVRDMWVENATTVLQGDTPGFTGILFDQWFRERDYREERAERLGFVNKDQTLEEVDNIGGGSSFDRTSFDGRGREMQVLDRFASILADSERKAAYGRLVTAEVIELCQDLFGIDPSLPS